MIRRRFLFAIIIFAPLAVHAASSSDEAQRTLRAAIDQLLVIADKARSLPALEASITPILSKHISFDAMTRRAVGPGWRQFNDMQQKKAISAFTKLIIHNYSSKFTIGEHPEITFRSAAEPAAGRVEVTTTTKYKGNRYAVIYRMEAAEGWRTTDVVIEGVSMVANYRSQLDPIFKKGGADAVVRSLEQFALRAP